MSQPKTDSSRGQGQEVAVGDPKAGLAQGQSLERQTNSPRKGQSRFPLDPLVDVVAALRGEGGCPWDREQTHDSLKPYLIEETYEALEALEHGDMHSLMEELGDLLLQIGLHAQIASETGLFDMNDIIQAITAKMIRRHPHVFGDVTVRDTTEVLGRWEKIKEQEKGPQQGSILDGVPRHLPALMRAMKIQKKAATVGFDWNRVEDALAKVQEEIGELEEARRTEDRERIREEIGDLLFAVVNVARFCQTEPETALTGTVEKFIGRFHYIEQAARSSHKKLEDMTLAEMDQLWERAKEGKS